MTKKIKRVKVEVNLKVLINDELIPNELQDKLIEVVSSEIADYVVNKNEEKEDEITDEEIIETLEKVFKENIDTSIWVKAELEESMKPMYIKSVREALDDWMKMEKIIETMIEAILLTNKKFKK